MLLKEWMSKNGMNPRRLSELTGLERTGIYHALRGRQRFSLEAATIIENATNGEVFRLEARYPELFINKRVVEKSENKNGV